MGNLIDTGSGIFIDGSWRSSGVQLDVLDKYTGKMARRVDAATEELAGAAVDSAVSAADAGPPSPAERSQVLALTAEVLRDNAAEIVEAYITETGFTRADAENELARARRIFDLSAQEALRISGEEIPVSSYPGSETRLAFTIREPVGVVCAITPFNAPLSTVAHKVAPALAAGNAVILKPAELTPLTAIAITSALLAAGLREQFVQLVCGDGETVGAALVAEPRIRYFTFTGSTAVGRYIKQASGIARTHLELGSNSATIVAADANLEAAADLITRAGFRKAGQVCTSVQRVLAVDSVAEELAHLVSRRAAALQVGDPRAPGVELGPVISLAAAERAADLVTEAVAVGAQPLAGDSRDRSLLPATVLWKVAAGCRLMTEEAFAPIVLVNPVSSVASAVAITNAGEYGLQAGIFTQDIDVAMAAAKGLRVGGVMINDTSSYHADNMPYSGVKDSGYGVQGPRYAVLDMTNSKLIVMNLRQPRETTT
jgi:acyl-CoA reductase-like NAD-dependent aldehyde dehydrogenase